MTTEISPAGMVCFGHTKAAWLPNLTYHPFVTTDDFAKPGAMNISFQMLNGFGPVYEDGRWQVKGCRYITDPQAPDDGLSGLLKPGTPGLWAFRYGPSATTDWEPGQIVNLLPSVLGPQSLVPSEPDEFARWIFDQTVFVSGPPLLGVELRPASDFAKAVAA